jgi:hypothetical protein
VPIPEDAPLPDPESVAVPEDESEEHALVASANGERTKSLAVCRTNAMDRINVSLLARIEWKLVATIKLGSRNPMCLEL